MHTKVAILTEQDLQFVTRLESFQKEFQHLNDPDDALGILMTAIPENQDFKFDQVFQNGDILPSLKQDWRLVQKHFDNHEPQTLPFPHSLVSDSWQPRLRATRSSRSVCLLDPSTHETPAAPTSTLYQEINCDGLVEIGLTANKIHNDPYHTLIYPSYILTMFANLTTLTHLTKSAANPSTNHIAQITMFTTKSPKELKLHHTDYAPWGIINTNPITFPIYTLDHNPNSTLNLFHTDLHHAFGKYPSPPTTLSVMD